jgi:predicted transcriptional regulator
MAKSLATKHLADDGLEPRDLEWEARMIAEGMAQADAGLTIPAEEVFAWIDSLGTDHPLPKPEPRRVRA